MRLTEVGGTWRGLAIASATAVILGSGASAASAKHAARSGGVKAPERPEVQSLRCPKGASYCRRGELLVVGGPGMDGASRVVFLGRRGSRDDRGARPRTAQDDELVVKVPSSAHSGPVEVVTDGAGSARSRSRLRVRAQRRSTPAETTPPPASAAGSAFPIKGEFTFGETTSNRFGGPRGHQGQDIFAGCGTPLITPEAVEVTRVATQSRAGNYVILKASDGRSFAYMHMRTPASVATGDELPAGTRVGEVGETGRASGCHLHFELWTAPGWYSGGKPIDPRPQLDGWAGRG